MPAASSETTALPEGLTDQVRGLAREQKARGAERLEGVAKAVQGAAAEIERDLPQAAGYIREAADRLESASQAVRDQSIEEILGAIDDFARRQPVAFFGGSVLAGFVLSRFLKSTSAGRSDGSRLSTFPAGPRGAESFPPQTDRSRAAGEE